MQPGQICHVDLRPEVSDGEICQGDMGPEGFRSHVRSHVAMRYNLNSGAIQHCITEVAVPVFDRAARGPPLEIPLAELKTTF